jgi:hypothetical protein
MSGYGCGKLASLLRTAIEPVISGHRGQPDIFVTIPVVLEGKAKQEEQESQDCGRTPVQVNGHGPRVVR